MLWVSAGPTPLTGEIEQVPHHAAAHTCTTPAPSALELALTRVPDGGVLVLCDGVHTCNAPLQISRSVEVCSSPLPEAL